MPAAHSMIHRCDLERDEGSAGTWGEKAPSWTAYLSAVHCRAWHQPTAGPERSTEAGHDRAAVEVMGIIVPVATAITDNSYRYRIASAGVTDRAGNTLMVGPIGIESILRRKDHLALRCSRAVGDG